MQIKQKFRSNLLGIAALYNQPKEKDGKSQRAKLYQVKYDNKESSIDVDMNNEQCLLDLRNVQKATEVSCVND